MSRPERFSVVAPLPPHGEWRRALALDRSGADPHAVVLAFVPQPVLDDAPRLAALVRDVEAAARLSHPSAVPVLGTETVGDALAVVEAHRPGTTLRALLDAGGRLPPDVAARIAVDACAAVARAHGIDAGDGKKLVHGAIAPSRIMVAEDGAALVLGFGPGAGAWPGDDVRALAIVLYECLAGEPPGNPPSSLEEAGASAALAGAVGRALAAPDAAASPASLAEAVAAAGPIASHADVAAYVDAILPPGKGARGELARALAAALGGGLEEVSEEVSEDYIVEPTDPTVRPPVETTLEPLPRPPATRPGVDPAGVFAAPPRPPERSRAPALAAVVCALVGFAAGFAAARLTERVPPGAGGAASAATEGPAAPTAAPPLASTPAKVAITTRPPRRIAAAKPHAVPAPRRSAKAAAKGKAAARGGKGMLHVSAPADAEVFLDERRIGKGSVHVEVAEGAHRIEVRLGPARVAERFTLAAGETWTYDVTPTP